MCEALLDEHGLQHAPQRPHKAQLGRAACHFHRHLHRRAMTIHGVYKVVTHSVTTGGCQPGALAGSLLYLGTDYQAEWT